MAPAIVLVMAEYTVGDSPLWHRGSRTHIGSIDAAGLGLSTSLRHDLRAWNDVFDRLSTTDFKWPSDTVRDAHAVDAFTLASRVQLELGDDVHVWCGAGRGVDTVGQWGTVVPLTSTHTGTTVKVLRDGTSGLSTARDAGAVEGTARAIVEWRALTKKAGRRSETRRRVLSDLTPRHAYKPTSESGLRASSTRAPPSRTPPVTTDEPPSQNRAFAVLHPQSGSAEQVAGR